MSSYCQVLCTIGFIFDVYLFDAWGPTCDKTDAEITRPTNYGNVEQITESQVTFRVYILNQTFVDVDEDTDWSSLGCGPELIVAFHGAGQNSSMQWILNMQQVYVENYGLCCMTVDFTYTAVSNLFSVVKRGDVNVIGAKTANFYLKVCVPGGVSRSSTHFVGFSLGSHVAGVSASQISEISGEQIAQVTGLDPGRLFEDHDPSERMSPSNAICVMAYYTYCAPEEGIYASRNYWWGQCGSNQYPVCQGDCNCDHGVSHDYFLFALRNQTFYTAYNCSECPYKTPQDLDSVTYGENTYCNNVTQFVLSNPDACEPGNLYVLPKGCVPSNL